MKCRSFVYWSMIYRLLLLLSFICPYTVSCLLCCPTIIAPIYSEPSFVPGQALASIMRAKLIQVAYHLRFACIQKHHHTIMLRRPFSLTRNVIKHNMQIIIFDCFALSLIPAYIFIACFYAYFKLPDRLKHAEN